MALDPAEAPRRHRSTQGDADRGQQARARSRRGDRDPQADHRQAAARAVRAIVRTRTIDQLELQLGELVEHVAQTATADEIATAQSQTNQHRKPPRRRPARRPLPEKLPRERRIEPSPTMCPCCGGRLRKLGEDITETLERVPAQWKVIQHVREVHVPHL